MHVIITGANRGIGLELAKIYEAQGCQVTKTSRKAMPGYATLDVNDPASHEAFATSLDGAPVLYVANAGINIAKMNPSTPVTRLTNGRRPSRRT